MPGDTQSPGVLVRADGNAEMGAGHLMRCLALAQAWGARGGRAVFVSHCPSDLRRRITSAGIDVIPLDRPHPDPVDLRTTLASLHEIARAQAARPWMVLDGPHFDPAYQHAIREREFPLLVVDDTAELPHYDADVLLNQNIGADRMPYRCSPTTVLLLGPRYVQLRREFRPWADRYRETPAVARRVLVTLGGGDSGTVASMAMRALALAGIDQIETAVLAGAANPRRRELEVLATAMPYAARVVHNASDMPELMAWADLAIAAGGTTCWELAFMGVPSLLLVLAENQRANAEGLDALGAAVNVGWHGRVSESQLAEAIHAVATDAQRRQALSRAGPSLVDGRGSEHVVDVMHAVRGSGLEEDQIAVRPATTDDAVPIWRLVNDPVVRSHSFTPETIPLDRHLEWFRGKLVSPGTRVWVLELARTLAAEVRYDRVDEETAEVHFAVVPALRGRGLGATALRLTWDAACRELRVKRVRGLVFRGNVASARAFEKAGFVRLDDVQVRGRQCHVFERRCTDGDV